LRRQIRFHLKNALFLILPCQTGSTNPHDQYHGWGFQEQRMHVLKRLFLLLTPYWKTIIISSLLLVGRAGLELVPPLFQREIIDEIITARNLVYLGVVITALIVVYALNQLVQIGDNYVRHALGEKFIFDLRVRLYAYLQKMSLSFFERTSTGELMSRVTNDLSALENFVTHGSALTAVDLMRLVGGAIILFVLDYRLAALVMIPVPILALAYRHYNTTPNCRTTFRVFGSFKPSHAKTWNTSAFPKKVNVTTMHG
jgi:ABC-type multidrug transport system fused ATPase/permease subunit